MCWAAVVGQDNYICENINKLVSGATCLQSVLPFDDQQDTGFQVLGPTKKMDSLVGKWNTLVNQATQRGAFRPTIAAEDETALLALKNEEAQVRDTMSTLPEQHADVVDLRLVGNDPPN